MKLAPIATCVAYLASSASAFAPAFLPRSGSTQLQGRVDSSEAIAEALRLSEEFGASSKEARLAWEVVEEMDSSDPSAAYEGGVTEEECLTSNSKECADYDEKVRALATLLAEQQASIEQVKSLANELQAIKLTAPSSRPSPDSSMMKKVLREANAAVAQYGADSTQAKLAWETVEEIAASDNGEVLESSLNDECLVEAVEACDALEELNRALNLQNESSRYQG